MVVLLPFNDPPKKPLLFSDDNPLSGFSEKHVQVLSATQWETLTDWELSDAKRHELRTLWWEHATDEYRALGHFSQLFSDMLQTGAPLPWLGCVSRLIRDETRHVALCVRVVVALGGDPNTLILPFCTPNSAGTPMDRIARGMLTTVFASETVALNIIGWARDRETIAPLKNVMTAILADESFHSRFGFLWLRDHWQQLTPQSQSFALETLPVALFRLHNGLPPFLKPIAKTAITDAVLPALQSFGISVTESWEISDQS